MNCKISMRIVCLLIIVNFFVCLQARSLTSNKSIKKKKFQAKNNLNSPEVINDEEDINEINLKYGILSDMRFKDGKKRDLYHSSWIGPNGKPKIPYTLKMAPGKDYSALIKQSIDMMNAHLLSGCNQANVWVYRTVEPDYVEFTSQYDGCWSDVGKQGGKQTLNIGTGCSRTGVVLHEMLHSVGFLHEHARCDRDLYIEVIFDNIQEEYWDQFYKQPFRNTFATTYDIFSIMQYNPWSFSIYNKTDRTDKTRVIRIRPEYANLTMAQQIYTVGRVNDLSESDKADLFVMLGCKKPNCTVSCVDVSTCPGVPKPPTPLTTTTTPPKSTTPPVTTTSVKYTSSFTTTAQPTTTTKPTTTTSKPTTTAQPTTTTKPTTTTSKPTTTAQPTTTTKPTTTTSKPTTTAQPTTTTKPTTTTSKPTTTAQPTTTTKPTTTSSKPTTTAQPTTTSKLTTSSQLTTTSTATPKPNGRMPKKSNIKEEVATLIDDIDQLLDGLSDRLNL